MSVTLRRWAMAAAGIVLAIVGAGAFAKAVGIIGDAQIWLLWVGAFPALGASRLLLTRVFGAGRFLGLRVAGDRLGLKLDLRAGEVVGRVGAIDVRIYPNLRRQVVVEARNGISDEPITSGGLGDPWRRATSDNILRAVRTFASEAEAMQRLIADRARTADESMRVFEVRRLGKIRAEMRIPEAADALALALKDDSKRVRLAAGSARGIATLGELFDESDVPWLITQLADPDARIEAARALTVVGTIDALAALKAAPRSPEVDRAVEAIESRTGAEGGRISIAPPEGGEISIARQSGELSKPEKT